MVYRNHTVCIRQLSLHPCSCEKGDEKWGVSETTIYNWEHGRYEGGEFTPSKARNR